MVRYTSLSGDKLEMKYKPEGLRCFARINGEKMDWDHFTDGAVYESPFIKVKNGKMTISNGSETYRLEIKDGIPVYRSL